MTDPSSLPQDLPVPEDDGAAEHLVGLRMPALALPATTGRVVALDGLPPVRTVLYLFPQMGRPGEPLPRDWDAIPGARGCTPEACAFRDHHRDLLAEGAGVLGLSAQPTEDLTEAVERLHLPFPLLSDESLELAQRLRLPTFEADGRRRYKRLTLIVREGVIEHVFYPVFPPDQHAGQVLTWLAEQRPSART